MAARYPVDGPGTGKTLASVCTGNTFGVRSLVGESEQKIRLMMDILLSIGGRDVLFLATANALDTLPAALQRRFNRGIWNFDVPNLEERAAIWAIQRSRFGLPDQELPDHNGWVGSDIRNCCEAAYTLQMPIVEAAQYITLAGRTARGDIEKLRDMAEQLGFLLDTLVEDAPTRQIVLRD